MSTLKQILEKYKAKHTLHGNEFLWKPENLEDIIPLIEEWLQKKQLKECRDTKDDIKWEFIRELLEDLK